jgi:hypothetical protein
MRASRSRRLGPGEARARPDLPRPARDRRGPVPDRRAIGHERKSLVPAPAVTPALGAYIRPAAFEASLVRPSRRPSPPPGGGRTSPPRGRPPSPGRARTTSDGPPVPPSPRGEEPRGSARGRGRGILPVPPPSLLPRGPPPLGPGARPPRGNRSVQDPRLGPPGVPSPGRADGREPGARGTALPVSPRVPPGKGDGGGGTPFPPSPSPRGDAPSGTGRGPGDVAPRGEIRGASADGARRRRGTSPPPQGRLRRPGVPSPGDQDDQIPS